MQTKRLNILIALTIGCLALCVITYCGVFVYGLTKDPQLSFKNFGRQFVDIAPLKAKLIEKFPCEDVTVEVSNGHVLIINMINSGDLKKTEDERIQKALEIARYTNQNYQSIDSIDLITINFMDRFQAGFEIDQFLTYNIYVKDLNS